MSESSPVSHFIHDLSQKVPEYELFTGSSVSVELQQKDDRWSAVIDRRDKLYQQSWLSHLHPSTPLHNTITITAGIFIAPRTRIPYTRHTTNDTVRSITGCLPVSEKVKSFQLRFFGHLARSAPEEDNHRVIPAALRPPPDWRRPPGRPRSTWLRVIDEDVQNFGVHTAWRKAKDRYTWHQVVSTAMLC